MLELVDQKRREVARILDPETKSSLGQFMTPAPIASFMAGLFSDVSKKEIRLLDAGAGIGSLTFAFLEKWIDKKRTISKIAVDAYEVDKSLGSHLSVNLCEFERKNPEVNFEYKIINGDFIKASVRDAWEPKFSFYTHAILNPPYKKISSDSQHRLELRSMGIETVNLYSAFVELAIKRLVLGGELVAIVPRSFCNGPYYKSFRKTLLRNTAIKNIHLFGSRKKSFEDDGVLQENIILHIVKGGISKKVCVSTSTDSTFSDLKRFECDIEKIVKPFDDEVFIHVPTGIEKTKSGNIDLVKHGLEEIGVEVSTGPIVDFRAKENLHKMPLKGDAPLLYPAHFEGFSIKWPKENIRKPNALSIDGKTKKMLFPRGYYVLVKRFSSKEEKKRICAVLLSPKNVRATVYGFENHVNVFHSKKNGLEENLARGLVVFLNSSKVDAQFREFSGHTQVNATDLRFMKYPPAKFLKLLGKKAKANGVLNQEKIDEMIRGKI